MPAAIGKDKSDKAMIAKVIGADADISDSRQLLGGSEGDSKIFSGSSVEIPYSPMALINVFEQSNSLRQMVDAYNNNVYATGYTIEPVIDIDAEGIEDDISDAVYAERLDEWITNGSEGNVPEDPTEDEVQERIKEIRSQIRRETLIASAFFKSVCSESSLVTLCKTTGMDLEITGNAYWEVMRDSLGRVARASHSPAIKTRLGKIMRKRVEVAERRYISDVKYEEVIIQRKFRSFLQDSGGGVVYFKEFGDPRAMSCQKGIVFDDEKAFNAAKKDGTIEEGDELANEMMHFKIVSTRTSYGIPRWIGVLLETLGSRAAGEVNYDYFDNKSIPPLAIIVSGGQLKKGADKVIAEWIKKTVKGRENFHSVLVLEATPGRGYSGKDTQPTVKLEPLTQYMDKDALFQNYDENNRTKIGAAFRLPPLLRGEIKDVNRSTAKATLQFAEEQVFGPEREDFDWVINETLGKALGLSLVKYNSIGVQVNDVTTMSEIMTKLLGVGSITINESRAILQKVLNRRLPTIDEFWANQPIEITKLGLTPSDEEEDIEEEDTNEEETEDGGVLASLERLSDMVKGAKALGEKIATTEQKRGLEANNTELDGSSNE